MSKTRRLVTAVVIAAPIVGTISGCYSYAYRLRAPTDLQRVAVENSPHTEVRWSSWWGAHENEWSPVECVPDQSGACRQVPYCDHGLGQVEVSYTAGTFVMTILTLGIAVPMRVSAWCATDAAPHHGP